MEECRGSLVLMRIGIRKINWMKCGIPLLFRSEIRKHLLLIVPAFFKENTQRLSNLDQYFYIRF